MAHFLIPADTKSTATGKEAGLLFPGVFPNVTPTATVLGLWHMQVHLSTFFVLHLCILVHLFSRTL